jgi:hypothetical protein
MTEDEELGPGNISYIASTVRDGTSTPDEAKRLLAEFVRQATGGDVEPQLIEHVRDCFAAYIARKRRLMPAPEVGRPGMTLVKIATLEKAFGLIRHTSGRPVIDRDTHCVVAMEVLKRLLVGETLEVASEVVAADRRSAGLPISAETDVRDAWAKHKMDGIFYLRISRLREVDPSAPPWTLEEFARLTELFEGEPWFVPPGVDSQAFMDATVARLDGRDTVPPDNLEN